MKIALVDVDSVISNVALMKISSWHKSVGDEVEWWSGPLFNNTYDRVFASKVFEWSSLPDGLPQEPKLCIGGTGSKNNIELAPEIENRDPDYSMYPNNNYSVGFITRGCIRKCKFCKVPNKEGDIRYDRDYREFENTNGSWWMFLDNNILSHPDAVNILRQIADDELIVDFNQGLDIRLLTPELAEQLGRIKWRSFIRFAWDQPKNSYDEIDVRGGIEMLQDYGIKPYKMMCYVLIGHNSTREQDVYRCMELKKLKVNPYAMVYDKSNLEDVKFSIWCNIKWIFKSCTWEEYKTKTTADELAKHKKGFKQERLLY